MLIRLPGHRCNEISDKLAGSIADQVSRGLAVDPQRDRDEELERARAALMSIGLMLTRAYDEARSRG